ncbi:DNA-directed RNA polymerase I subunit RPA34.5-domain-containing protein [Melanogaster broomeanus]|nr:DNA-directed RNA polymerase I subunit RPA34.5-domain-containing protein [Melanogaster broomeanus]
MSSSDLEAPIVQPSTSKKHKSSKKKSKPTGVVTADGKNEGDDPHWAYEPPAGAVLVDHAIESEHFEWDAIKDDEDSEIWLIRVPDSIKAKHLDGLEIYPPSLSSGRVGSLTRKNVTYDVWSLGDDETGVVGGEELRGLSCLLPRKKKKGKLCIAPKPISRHFVIAAQPTAPTVPEHQPVIHQNPPRPSYPKHVLKHRFVPYGARSDQGMPDDLLMDVDDAHTPATEPADRPNALSSHHKDGQPKESKGKKRKVEGETPKKSKKRKSNN